ncbi:YhgE/Pip domain-containing protein [uncultured Slackia sp.]|uniref:YhgE/Pip domain-containing protein n=1 Tax=uncultured Slackia sp. TaxID=665903 RepID=UPI0026DFCCB5|nr:YhgE/Pip domain-containing protein [uncultured Slackia sp.]
MRNIWRLFTGDLKRLGHNVITVIIVLGLVAIPSLFSWYNLIACWNVFDNTGNLKVAVANSDEGYKSDLVPLEINVGEQVVSALRANDQLKWTITDEEDAIDGARSGRYYAAVVIPSSFSRDMMTFYSDDVEHAKITYYTNEKKNAIAPKVTDQGADGVSAQVNTVFAETLSEVALGIATTLADYAENSDMGGRIGELAVHIDNVGSTMDKASSVLTMYSSVLGSAQSLVDDSAALLGQVKNEADGVKDSVSDIKAAAGDVGDAIGTSASALSTAIEQSAASYGAVVDSVDAAFDSASSLASSSASQLTSAASRVDGQIGDYRNIIEHLESLKPLLPSAAQSAVDTMTARLNASIALQEQLRDSLNSAAADIEAGRTNTQAKRDEIKGLAQQAKDALSGAKADYDTQLKPDMEALSDTVGEASATFSSTAATLDATASDLSGAAGSVSSGIGDAKQKLDAAASDLSSSAQRMHDAGARIAEAAASGDVEALRAAIGSDPSALAKAVSAPVKLDRHAVYPVDNFGSAMTPLYTTLALWIGALLVMVTLKVTPSKRILDQMGHVPAWQQFIGRFGVVALISLMQSTCVSVGNMVFLGVQTANPFLYLLCYWVSGLVFAFIIYTLVVSFANFGKAISVFLLIIQVSGGGGSYPLQSLPTFVQELSPYLPVTHAVNAMRAAMFGVYNGDFWTEIGILLLFTVPFIVLGLVLRTPLIKVVSKFVEMVESSKVM